MKHNYSNAYSQTNRNQLVTFIALSLLIGGCGSDSSNSTTNTPNPVIQNPNDPPTTDAVLPGESRTTAIGDVLVFGESARTLYTFANDVDNQSNCNDSCAESWPPIVALSEQTLGNFNTIVRIDSSLQWALKGSPLYHYAGDASEGEINGEGLGNVWFVARPDPISTGPTTLGTALVGQATISTGTNDPSLRSDYNNRTLYLFSEDPRDGSVCNDVCADRWPPLYADKGATAANGFTIITREDGTSQWAINSQALYFFEGDSAPGDINGNGIGGTWFVALTDFLELDPDL